MNRATPLPVLGALMLGALVIGALTAACGSTSTTASTDGIPIALLREARPIGRGPQFHPAVKGDVLGPCTGSLGPREGVHIELFAANRVVIVAEGIGTRPPWTFSDGRIAGARCYGALVTLEPTGVVLVRPGAKLTLADLFREWGEPLSEHRLTSFTAVPGATVATFIDGHRWNGPAASVPLTRHAEIVLEVGPYVPPHHSYTFPPGT